MVQEDPGRASKGNDERQSDFRSHLTEANRMECWVNEEKGRVREFKVWGINKWQEGFAVETRKVVVEQKGAWAQGGADTVFPEVQSRQLHGGGDWVSSLEASQKGVDY